MDNQNTGGRRKKDTPFGYSAERNAAMLLTSTKKDNYHWRQTPVFRTHELYELSIAYHRRTMNSFAHSLDVINQTTKQS